MGGNPTPVTTGSSHTSNNFDGYRLSIGSSARHSNDPNQPPLTAFVNRVNKSYETEAP